MFDVTIYLETYRNGMVILPKFEHFLSHLLGNDSAEASVSAESRFRAIRSFTTFYTFESFNFQS